MPSKVNWHRLVHLPGVLAAFACLGYIPTAPFSDGAYQLARLPPYTVHRSIRRGQCPHSRKAALKAGKIGNKAL